MAFGYRGSEKRAGGMLERKTEWAASLPGSFKKD